MAWTATITQVTKGDADFTAAVEFTDGAEVRRGTFRDSTMEGLKSQLKAKIDGYDKLSSTVIPVGAVDLAPPPVKPPTQEELDLKAFRAAQRDWQIKSKALDSGLSKTITQEDVDAAYVIVKTLYKEEYGPFL